MDKPALPVLTALLATFAIAAFVASPFFTDPFSGYGPEVFPVPQVDPPVQPAGYAFSIWGLIYLWLVVHAAFGLVRRRDAPAWVAIRWPVILGLGPGALWLWVAGRDPVWASALILWMLACALWALLRAPRDLRDRWVLQAPLAIYAGWLTAASAVSVGLLLGGYGYASGVGAALIALSLGVLCAGVVQWLCANAPEYGAAVIWALIGVIVANLGGSGAVSGLAGAGIVAIAALIVRGMGRPSTERLDSASPPP